MTRKTLHLLWIVPLSVAVCVGLGSLTGGYSTPRERRERAEKRRLAEIQAKQFQEVQSIEASMEASLRKGREAAARVSMGLAFAHLLSERNPGVAKSEVVLRGDKTIYHVRDWHYATREALGEVEGIEGDKLDAQHAGVLDAARAVHKSKLLILEGTEAVWQEGMTDENATTVVAEIRSLAVFHEALRREGLEDQEHEEKLLRLGAGAEMLLNGKPIVLLPADDHDAHEAARPTSGKFDDAANRAREEAIVRRIVAKGETAILVLGGDHDLTEAIKAHPDWGYVRITPKGFPE